MSWSEIVIRRVDDLVDATQISPELINHLYSKKVINRDQRDTLSISSTTNASKCSFLYNNIAERLTAAKVVHFKGALKAGLCDLALEILEKEEAKDEVDSKENYPSGKNFALIINIRTGRPGAEKDDTGLLDTLEGCGFAISICKDWSNEGIKSAIIEFKRKLTAEVTAKIGSVLIVVASHGTTGDVFGMSKEESLKLDEHVIDQFNGANCEVLVGIPKVFLVNFCRGKKVDIPGAERKSADTLESSESFMSSFDALWKSRTGAEYDELRGKKPTWSDLLVAYASYDEHVALRSASGTVFLQAFCDVVRTEAKGKSMCIKKLLEKVSAKIIEDRSENSVKQVPMIKHTGFNKSLKIQYH